MSVVMSDNFNGVAGQAFTGDASYTPHGTCTFAASSYGVGVRLAAGTQSYLDQTAFTGTTLRVYSRIYKVSAAPTAVATIFQARTASASLCMAQMQASTGKLQLAITTASPLATSTASVPIGTEFRVVYTVNGTSFTAAIYPNTTSTTPTQTLSCTITSGSMTFSRDGVPTTGGAVGADVDIIWPVDDSAADPGLRQYVSVTIAPALKIVPATITATPAVLNAVAGNQVFTVDWSAILLNMNGATAVTLQVVNTLGTQSTTSVAAPTASTLQAALQALSNVNGLVIVGGSGPFTMVFDPSLGSTVVTVTASTGGTPTVARTATALLALTGATAVTLAVINAAGTQTTASLTTMTTAAVQTAIQALSNVGAGKATVTGSTGGPYTVDFDSSLGTTTISIVTSTGSTAATGTTVTHNVTVAGVRNITATLDIT